jgi:glutaredoxin-related protein
MAEVEDSWAASTSYQLTRQMKETAGTDMRLLEGVVAVAEGDTIDHPGSAFLNYFLAHTYQGLPEELSLDSRKLIEREKLERKGKEYLLKMPNDPSVFRTEEGPDLVAAADYLQRTNVHMYLAFGNVQRAVLNLNRAIENSRGRSEYDNVKNATSLSFLLDKRMGPHLWTTAIAFEYS